MQDSKFTIAIQEVFPSGNPTGEPTTARVRIHDVRSRDYRHNRRSHKVYVDCFAERNHDADEAELDKLAQELGAPSKHTRRGEYKELDRAWDRLNKQIVAEKRALMDKVFGALNIEVTDVKFSRYTGCRCGCSPAFSVKGHFDQPKDIFISEQEAEEATS